MSLLMQWDWLPRLPPFSWSKSLFSIFMPSLDFGQIVAVKLCLNFIVEKQCVIKMYEKGKISCLWIMK